MTNWRPRFLARTRTRQPVRPCHISYPRLCQDDSPEPYWIEREAAERAEEEAMDRRMWTTEGKVRVACVGCDAEMYVPLLCAASPAYCRRFTHDCFPTW